MIYDEKREGSWHKVGNASKKIGPGYYSSNLTSQGARSAIGMV